MTLSFCWKCLTSLGGPSLAHWFHAARAKDCFRRVMLIDLNFLAKISAPGREHMVSITVIFHIHKTAKCSIHSSLPESCTHTLIMKAPPLIYKLGNLSSIVRVLTEMRCRKPSSKSNKYIYSLLCITALLMNICGSDSLSADLLPYIQIICINCFIQLA